MPIRFRCIQCEKLLQTPDGTEGKRARCPACGAVTPVPGSEEALPRSEQSLPSSEGLLPTPDQPLPSPEGPPSEAEPSPASEAEASGPAWAPPEPRSVLPYDFPAPSRVARYIAEEQLPEIRPSRILMEQVLDRAWTIFTQRWGICVGAVLVAAAISIGFTFARNVMIQGLGREPKPIGLLFILFATILYILVTTWLQAGMLVLFLRVARGKPAHLEDIFSGVRYLFCLFVYDMVVVLVCLTAGGGCLWAGFQGASFDPDSRVLWGLLGVLSALGVTIFLEILFSQGPFLIVDRNLGPIRALTLSVQLTRGNRLALLGVRIVGFFLMILGALLCCVGALFVAAPYLWVVGAVSYLSITGQSLAPDLRYQRFAAQTPVPPKFPTE